jgi:hypothetical protein
MRFSTILQIFLSGIIEAVPALQVTTSAPPTTSSAIPSVYPAGSKPGPICPTRPLVSNPGYNSRRDLTMILWMIGIGLGPCDDMGKLAERGLLTTMDLAVDAIIAANKAVIEKTNALKIAADIFPATRNTTAAALGLLGKVKDTGSAFNDATTKVRGIQSVGLYGTSRLGSDSQEVAHSLIMASSAIEAKRDMIIKTGQKAHLLQAAQDLKSTAYGWAQATYDKLVPPFDFFANLPQTYQNMDSIRAAAEDIIHAFSQGDEESP